MTNCATEHFIDACYGGYIWISCGSYFINVTREEYGRHPQEKCKPSPDGSDCSVTGTFYHSLCNGKNFCDHLGVRWRLVNTPGCEDVYTNYVNIGYVCYTKEGLYT